MKRIVLIDGDIDLFQVTQSCEIEVQWDEDTISMSTDLELAKKMIDERIQKAMKDTDCDEYIFCLTGDNNFRKKHFTEYKANRAGVRKPMGYKNLKTYVMENYKCKFIDTLEADDLMGIYATLPTKKEVKYVIYSADKDMQTIPCEWFDSKTGKTHKITPTQALRYLYGQVLTGDVADGYKGLPKVGQVKADRALAKCKTGEEMRDVVLGLYVKYYKEEELAKQEMLRQCRMARILRHSDWDKKNQEVILWNPWSENGND